MSGDAFATIVVSALVLGSLYAIMAVGLAVVWQALGIFNFAHGLFMTLGAYVAWQVASGAGWGLWPGIAAAVAASAVVGAIACELLVRPFLGRKDVVLVAVITTLAGATLIESGVLLAWGGRPKQLPPLSTGTVDIFGAALSAHEATIVVVTPLILLGVWLFLGRTRTGAALRAVAQNHEAAALMGLPAARLYALAFALAAGLAAVAGIFLGAIRFMSPAMGGDPLLKAMVVVIFGGVARFAGPVAAAYLIGLAEAVSTYAIGLYWTPSVLFLFMIGTLMLRPQGLFGGARR